MNIHFLGVLVAISFAACSSGSDDANNVSNSSGGSAPSPTIITAPVNITVNNKHIHFTWTPNSFSWNANTTMDHYRILENPNGASGFTVVPNASHISLSKTSYSVEIAVHKFNWLTAKYLVEACDLTETTCVPSTTQTFTLSDSIAGTIYIKASNTDADDYFGIATAISGDGNTLAIGASWEDSAATGINGNQTDNSIFESGAVYVFTRTPAGDWSQQAYLKAAIPEPGIYFGNTLALSDNGNTLVVGSPHESWVQAISTTPNVGSAYVFTRVGATWTQQANLVASRRGPDLFASAVTISGDGTTIAVGAPLESSAAMGINGNQNPNAPGNWAAGAGAVYVFTNNAGGWTQQAYIKASNTDAGTNNGGQFGIAVALNLDGSTLAVGAHQEDSAATGINGNQADNSAADSGAVYVFTNTGGIWSQQAYIKASNTNAGDWFGKSIALNNNGNLLAVGAKLESSATIGINGNQADNSAADSGAVYVFTNTGGIWSQQAYIKASNTSGLNYFGNAIALDASGNTLAVGATRESGVAAGINGDQTQFSQNSGAVYLFEFNTSLAQWAQKSYIKSSNPGAWDALGSSVSLSDDGNTLAAGAEAESSHATGINGDQTNNTTANAGAVYLY